MLANVWWSRRARHAAAEVNNGSRQRQQQQQHSNNNMNYSDEYGTGCCTTEERQQDNKNHHPNSQVIEVTEPLPLPPQDWTVVEAMTRTTTTTTGINDAAAAAKIGAAGGGEQGKIQSPMTIAAAAAADKNKQMNEQSVAAAAIPVEGWLWIGLTLTAVIFSLVESQSSSSTLSLSQQQQQQPWRFYRLATTVAPVWSLANLVWLVVLVRRTRSDCITTTTVTAASRCGTPSSSSFSPSPILQQQTQTSIDDNKNDTDYTSQFKKDNKRRLDSIMTRMIWRGSGSNSGVANHPLPPQAAENIAERQGLFVMMALLPVLLQSMAQVCSSNNNDNNDINHHQLYLADGGAVVVPTTTTTTRLELFAAITALAASFFLLRHGGMYADDDCGWFVFGGGNDDDDDDDDGQRERGKHPARTLHYFAAFAVAAISVLASVFVAPSLCVTTTTTSLGMLLLMVFVFVTVWYGIFQFATAMTTTAAASSLLPSLSSLALYQVFTCGEWFCVTALLAMTVTEWTLSSVSFVFATFSSSEYSSSTTLSSPSSSINNNVNSMTDQLMPLVAGAGFLGTLVACTVLTDATVGQTARVLLRTLKPSSHNPKDDEDTRSNNGHDSRQNKVHVHDEYAWIMPENQRDWQLLVEFVVRLAGLVLIPLATVEAVLWMVQWQPPLLELAQQSSFVSFYDFCWFAPKCLQWLFDFLSRHESSATVLLPGQSTLQIPRWVWLVYWGMVLMVSLWLAPIPQQQKQQEQTGQSHRAVVVVTRKWFHAVAVVLFGPPTILAPNMLSLSYAIAVAVCCAFEQVRRHVDACQRYLPGLQEFYVRYLDTAKDVVVVNVTANSSNTSAPTNTTTTATRQQPQPIVISHMALIAGCAVPLWLSQYCTGISAATTMTKVNEPAIFFRYILPFWGIVCLGVGDAMGACVGIRMGRTRWSRTTHRTVEGSVAMFLSMLVAYALVFMVVAIFLEPSSIGGTEKKQDIRFSWSSWWWTCIVPATAFVTLLEAYTLQIDNLVLPLAGAVVLLLCCC